MYSLLLWTAVFRFNGGSMPKHSAGMFDGDMPARRLGSVTEQVHYAARSLLSLRATKARGCACKRTQSEW